ncbi:HMG box-containing protein 4 isoform X2 [Hetaerina americana]|uniref:HMG box-containing protein 4 isoform X2 n=1 Tax=Hetaerina americana TaxID=62018 RepID=UPI003A7F16D2
MEKNPKRKRNSDSPGSFAAFLQKKTKQEGSDHLEVTGVSRSGRVRKKSSKLTDFESPDEIDPRYRRRVEKEVPIPKQRAQTTHHAPAAISSIDNSQAHGQSRARIARESSPLPPSQSEDEEEEDEEEDDAEEEANYVMKNDSESTMESGSEMGMYPHEGATAEDFSSDSSGGGEYEEGEMEDEGLEEEEEEEGEAATSDDIGSNHHMRSKESDTGVSQATSLYMLEKSSKKKLIVRDGKIVGRMKAQRKDKGKTRFTAYMLWAKEVRQEILRVNPDMDFATISKRLGELWATVPTNEKYNWKRRAKRLAVKGNRMGVIDTARWKSPPARNKFLNKTGSRPVDRASSRWQNASHGQQRATQPAAQQATPPSVPTNESSSGPVAGVVDPTVGTGLYKVVGTQPVDVAAHLGLLGESLMIIGERLTEHEGQIAVSGSLSVLLDSLLCAIGPLLCLAQQIPEAAHACPQHTLSKILDNIAYVMPGL